MNHEVIWTQPPALMTGASRLIPTPRSGFETPAILRFTADAFMPEFLNLLETNPERLREYRVRRETWRGVLSEPVEEPAAARSAVLERLGIAGRRALPRATGSATLTEAGPAATPLKLYQPAQQRYYLVVSSLVCKVTGLPDRGIDPGRGEQTASVIRRLMPPAGEPRAPIERWEEHAWVAGQQGYVWENVGATPLQLLPGEERLPLFAVHFAEHERRKRRLLAGVIPVGKREAYLGAPKSTGRGAGGVAPNPGVTPRTSRKILFRKEVVEPWKTLVRRAQDVSRSFTGPFIGDDRAPRTAERTARLKLEREHIQTVSWLVLLDFAKYLSQYVKPVWRAVLQPTRRDDLTPAERNLFDALQSATLSTSFREIIRRSNELTESGAELYALGNVFSSLRRALAEFGDAPEGLDAALERQLEAVDQPYDRGSSTIRALYPNFLFPLADPDLPGLAPLPAVGGLSTLNAEERDELALDENPAADDPLERLDKLAVLVLRALRDDAPAPPQPAVPAAAIPPADAFDGTFVIRCVYERPACEPLHGAVVSAPTEPFQMAGFFDPDAPARPVRIGLPVDTTPAGLRKFDKNTALVISDTLCGQIRRFKGMSLGDLVLSVLPWPLHKDLPGGSGAPCKTGDLSLGMICSISIPIITLCALILLMIIVSLLDFIFRWMPYFIICFPVPGLKAKRPESPA
jgi:hypothetical protein